MAKKTQETNFVKKSKSNGPAKKQFGPKEQKPKAYRGQGK